MFSATHPPPPPSDTGSSPLLSSSLTDNLIGSRRRLIRQPLRLLRCASGRRMRLREPSVRVRESAAEQHQKDWAFFMPFLVFDLLWNTMLLGIGLAVLWFSYEESPEVPLRVWIGGYMLQCVVHMFCVGVDCMRRRRLAAAAEEESLLWESSSRSGSDESEDYGMEQSLKYSATSFAKILEDANIIFSVIWWILGFHWVTASSESLTTDSPQLYWTTATFLAMGVVCVVFWVVWASLIGIMALIYVVTDPGGATKEQIDHLPKYKFRKISDFEKVNGEIQESFGGIMTKCDPDTPTEHALSQEDAEYCICLFAYDDGTELRELPCRHHFHCTCIDKWLQIIVTCPLCEFNILKSAGQSSSEEV